ncbi:hypothetical protein DPX16_22801, partial [Anabarilius grahami]
ESVTSLERAANNHSDQLVELQANVNKLTAQVESLFKKCEDLEGCSRWNNIRLVGLPDGSEGSRTTEFIAHLLQEILGLDSQPVLLEKRKAASPPFIIKVNSFQVQSQILRCAWQSSPLLFNGKKLSIFPDFAPSVAKKRTAFASVKKELHSCPNVKFGLRFPATLQITLPGGEVHRFEDPNLALVFVRKNIKK